MIMFKHDEDNIWTLNLTSVIWLRTDRSYHLMISFSLMLSQV